MNLLRCFVGLTCWIAVAPLVHAHPGHGAEDSDSIGHYLLEPAHSLPILAAIGSLLIAGGVWRKLRRRQVAAKVQ